MALQLSRNPAQSRRAKLTRDENGPTSPPAPAGAQNLPGPVGPLSPSGLAPPRVVITHVEPQIDGGRFPVKRIVGDKITVTADIFADGHDVLTAVLRYRKKEHESWVDAPMREINNDRWTGEFVVVSPGLYEYTIEAWIDHFKSWHRDLSKKVDATQVASSDLLVGASLIDQASQRATEAVAEEDAARLRVVAAKLRSQAQAPGPGENAAESGLPLSVAFLNEDFSVAVAKYPDRRSSRVYDPPLLAVVDCEKASFSAWYEMFPRSCAKLPGEHGTLLDCESRLPYIAAMGFDVLYLPPIHPIGRTYRKGKNNSPANQPGDPGSPWAIGAAEGGHTSIHPQLGTLQDFAHLLTKAREHHLEIALDIAYQCSPDHPWVKEHPEWFVHRPDGTIQYAENPPKKYQDIYPLNFECEQWKSLWEAARDVVLFWIAQGVRIFRVDNPHTKPFAFWEWLIHEVKLQVPEVIFLAEAFTRPKVMKQLAKVGFSQSYTYFAWRNTKQELTEYFTELTQTAMQEYFRPNLWPNTPDILTGYAQQGGRPAFMVRLVLAATLGANYGIYGPPFELCENVPLAPGKEEYLNAEKYEIRLWNLEQPGSLSALIARVNRARRENPALQRDLGLRFHFTDNEQIIAYTKSTGDNSNVVLVVVNLDPHNTQSGWVTLPLETLGLSARDPYQVHDLLTDARYLWQGPRNYVRLDPGNIPAHLFRVRRHPV
ncbi:MAG: alpha-1,4-glucan--maltose-1-phosphate maltosyltransferase [Terriglobia bacterium]